MYCNPPPSAVDFFIFMGAFLSFMAIFMYYINILAADCIKEIPKTTAQLFILIGFPVFGYFICKIIHRVEELEEAALMEKK